MSLIQNACKEVDHYKDPFCLQVIVNDRYVESLDIVQMRNVSQIEQ